MNYYLLFKSLHLIDVISWMVGLLYLPRIFVYHANRNIEKNTSETFKTMEKLKLKKLTKVKIIDFIPRVWFGHT